MEGKGLEIYIRSLMTYLLRCYLHSLRYLKLRIRSF